MTTVITVAVVANVINIFSNVAEVAAAVTTAAAAEEIIVVESLKKDINSTICLKGDVCKNVPFLFTFVPTTYIYY
jgi:hypothetical protein